MRLRFVAIAAIALMPFAGDPATPQTLLPGEGLTPTPPGRFEFTLVGSRVRAASFRADARRAGELPGDIDLDSMRMIVRGGLSRRLGLRLSGEWRRNTFMPDRLGSISSSGVGWTGLGLEWAPDSWQSRRRTMRLGFDALHEGSRQGDFPVRSGRPGADLWLGSTWEGRRSAGWGRVALAYRQRNSDATKSAGELRLDGGQTWTLTRFVRAGFTAEALIATEANVAGAAMFNDTSVSAGAGLRLDLVEVMPHTAVSLFGRWSLFAHNALDGTRIGIALTIWMGSP